MRKYTDQKNSKYKHLSRSVYLSECTNLFPILKIEFVACLKSVNLGISLLHSFNSNCISLTFSSNFYAGTSTYVPIPVVDSFNVRFYWDCSSQEVLGVFSIILSSAKTVTILLVIIYCYLMRYEPCKLSCWLWFCRNILLKAFMLPNYVFLK